MTGARHLRSFRRDHKSRKAAEHALISDLATAWQDCGVCSGDILLLHSDISRLILKFRHHAGISPPDAILQSFLKALGPEGTLLLPSFSFAFSRSAYFDIRHTPSEMGVLTECARHHPAALRTHHPLASFVVMGAEAQRFKNLSHFSGWGQDSPLALLHQLRGKIAVLDVCEKRSMTFYHYVEEHHQVPYRFHKIFMGSYVDAQGHPSPCKASLFVRRLDLGIVTNTRAMGEYLWQQGLYQGQRPGTGCGLRVIRAEDVFRETTEVIGSGQAEGMLYQLDSCVSSS